MVASIRTGTRNRPPRTIDAAPRAAGPIAAADWSWIARWGTLVRMSARLVDGGGGRIERWLSGLAGPELVESPPATGAGYDSSSGGDVKCPICDRPRSEPVAEVEQYDEDFDYYWGDFRLPLWIALIWQVPWRQRLDIFVIGFSIGLIIAGIAVFWGLLLAQY